MSHRLKQREPNQLKKAPATQAGTQLPLRPFSGRYMPRIPSAIWPKQVLDRNINSDTMLMWLQLTTS